MILVDPSFFFFLGGVGYLIEIVQMALSYYLNKLRKETMDGMILRALHELVAPSAGQLKVFK